MTTKSHKPNLDRLDALLEAERNALLQGNLEALARMLPDKEALIGSLSGTAIDDLPALEALDVKVRRNQLLLDGALEGIREVASRMAEMRKMQNGIETYSPDGQKQNIAVRREHTLERRA